MTKIIQKAKLNAGGLEVSYKEFNNEQGFTNEYTVKCPQIIHKDLQAAFDALKAHVACICEFPEAAKVSSENIDTIHEEMDKIVITGYTSSGSDETAGACIIAQRLVVGSKILNITTPFMQFSSEDYPYASDLDLVIQGCDDEVIQYLENGKFGIKQTELDFADESEEKVIAEAENIGISVTELKKQKGKGKGKKKNPKEEPVEVF